MRSVVGTSEMVHAVEARKCGTLTLAMMAVQLLFRQDISARLSRSHISATMILRKCAME